MPRQERIEYENAFYHVMNRGRGRQAIFHNKLYYQAFLETLVQAHERFKVKIHAYCLMGNHYHLLLQTPEANLSRVMRHINGVYTQRYNLLKKTDGPLFRGRFKAIVVDADSYLLQLSRYIHLNPIATQPPLVKHLADYAWSSYPAYINQAKAPAWLSKDMTYEMLGVKRKFQGYKQFVEAGVGAELEAFYSKKNISSVLGSKSFKESLLKKQQAAEELVFERPSANEVINMVAKVFSVSKLSIKTHQQGKQLHNMARKFAMYSCQHYAALKLSEIAAHFDLLHTGSVSNAVHQVREGIKSGDLMREKKLMDSLIMMQRT